MLQDIIGAKKDLFADGVQTVLRGQENRTRATLYRTPGAKGPASTPA